MLINGEKYACEACVRGHRVSNCQHSGKHSHSPSAILAHDGLVRPLHPRTPATRTPAGHEFRREENKKGKRQFTEIQ